MNKDAQMQVIMVCQAIGLLIGAWIWWKYTERRGWGFIGLVIFAGPIAGGALGYITTAPFTKPEDDVNVNEFKDA